MSNNTEELKKFLDEWLEGRPESIRNIAEKIKPWDRYRIKPTGQHCELVSYYEDGTVKVFVNGHDNEALDVGYKGVPICVFGINPDDLEVITSGN